MSAVKTIKKLPKLLDTDVETQLPWVEAYIDAVGDILSHPKYQQLKSFDHHKPVSCHFHSVFVSFLTFRISSELGCDAVETARAAALHDFYLYDWYLTKHDELHAWYHPKIALINSEMYFGKMSETQTDMILSHMWPLHIKPPKTREGMILTMVDKYCTSADMLKLSKKFLPLYERINREIENYEDNRNNR